MNDKDPAAYDLLTYAWVFVLSLMGGVVAFLQKLRDGNARVFNLIEFIGELCTSAFTGVVTFYPKNGNEIAWIISQLSAVVQNAGANGVFFNSPSG